MKPARFDYVRAESLAEAHDVLATEGGEVSVLAGGQSLLPLLSTRLARPKVVLDIMRIPGLDVIAQESDAIRIGATVRQAKLAAWPELTGGFSVDIESVRIDPCRAFDQESRIHLRAEIRGGKYRTYTSKS